MSEANNGAGGGEGGGTPAAWHAGVDADVAGFWQNKGLPLDNPKDFAVKLTEMYRGVEKHVGAPPDQLLRLPKDASDAAGWDNVWQRLGVPKDAKEYDLSQVKTSDGKDIDPAFADLIRQSAITNRVPKDAAAALARDLVKFNETQTAAAHEERVATLAREKETLKQSWGQNHDLNLLRAKEGATRLGLDPATVEALENQVGYAKVMEMFRKVGVGTSESTFVDGGNSGGQPATREAAVARLGELQNDTAWAKRLLAGDSTARREFENLTALIAA